MNFFISFKKRIFPAVMRSCSGVIAATRIIYESAALAYARTALDYLQRAAMGGPQT